MKNSIFLLVSIAASAIACADSASADGAPLLRIAVMSDIQGYPYPEDAGMRNLERALDVLAELKPDVVVNSGDINDSGMDMDAVRYYKERCDARLGPIPHVASLGNHEIGFIPAELASVRTSARCRAEFNAIFGAGPELVVHRVVKGHDFIALALSQIRGYTANEIALLEAALEKAVRRDARKPIFVITHYHPLNTVNSSGSKEEDGGLRALLNRYPQVISLSGHSHNPLQDPRSIWQGEFTAIDMSTLCYGCIEMNPPAANQISCLIPYGHESVGCLLLEVHADRVVARRFSVRNRREIEPETPWTVALPHDPASARYSPEARRAAERPPAFPEDGEPTLWYDYGYVYFLFAAAVDRSAVFGYRIELTEAGGVPKSYFQISDYYRIPEHRVSRVAFKVPAGALAGGRAYECRIFPVGFFGAEGKPITWRFTAKSGYPYRSDRPNVLPE